MAALAARAQSLNVRVVQLAAELEQLTLENTRLKRRYEAVQRTCQITRALLVEYAAYQEQQSDLLSILRRPSRQEEALRALDQQIQQLLVGSGAVSQPDSQAFAWKRDPLEWFHAALQHVDWVIREPSDVETTLDVAKALVRPYLEYLAQYKAARTPGEAAAAAKLAEDHCCMVNVPIGISYWFQRPYMLYKTHSHTSAEVPEEVWGPLLAAMDLTLEQQEQVTDLFLVFEDLQAPYVQRRKQLLQLLSQSEAWLQSQLASGSPAAATTSQADLAASAAQGQPQPQQQQVVMDPLLAPLPAAPPNMAAAGAVAAPAAADAEAAAPTAVLTPAAAQQIVVQLGLEFHQLAWLEHCFHFLSACLLDWRQIMELLVGYDGQLQVHTWEGRVAASVLQQRRDAGWEPSQGRAAAGGQRPTPEAAAAAIVATPAGASTAGSRLSGGNVGSQHSMPVQPSLATRSATSIEDVTVIAPIDSSALDTLRSQRSGVAGQPPALSLRAAVPAAPAIVDTAAPAKAPPTPAAAPAQAAGAGGSAKVVLDLSQPPAPLDVQAGLLQRVPREQARQPGGRVLPERPHLQLGAPHSHSSFPPPTPQVASTGCQQQLGLGSTPGMQALLGGIDLEEGDWLLAWVQQEVQGGRHGPAANP